MKNFFKTTLVITSLVLTACSTAPADMEKMMDDHHEGGTNVMPHGHEDEAKAMPMHDEDVPMPPSRSNKANDDHHEEEENVEPHGH